MLRRKSTQEQPTAQGEVTDAVINGESRSQTTPYNTPKRGKTKKWLIGLTAVVVIAGVGGYVLFDTNSDQSATDKKIGVEDPRAGVNTSSDPEDLKDPITKLKENPPSSTESAADKARYYSDLAQLHGDKTDYEAAIQAFTEGEKVAAAAMTYRDYYMWAYYYQQTDDKQAAVEKLKKVLQLLPDVDEANTGYDKAELSAQINARIKELSR